ncbi:MAG: bifunctional adenosylcobinamide kinase/adenosylcobinamide-phosphate guanylyltransferase [Nitrospirae bacterium]|nr:MAG: bifunctional adenosylcobinamide kinase/adenosylcobinamide-phosphate guanylyltransferase [Nitrospirota bacterium]
MSSRRGRLIFILGGAASGKSETALAMAGNAGPRAFVATGQPLDGEMAERIRRHQASRQADWRTEEVPVDLAGWFDKQGRTYRIILVDCLTLWLSNLQGRGVPESQVPALVSELLRAIRAVKARVVVVSNELGLGLVPTDVSARRFRDLAGRVNQQFAAEADEAYFVVSGLPVRIK